ncbi:axin isoform X2 [Coccinella septempunctata]|uniref:axin isoform X2 n=1 Tax=Coccinella septempunctata TaxID=41139 RepID=UPI001D07541D|nr:axin isoform X2 [Coccinella septempunctata]
MSDCEDVNNSSKVGCSVNSSRLPNEGSKFYLTSPRPPVPGEERSQCVSDWGQPYQMDLAKKQDGDTRPLAIPPRSATPSAPPQLPPKPNVSQAAKVKKTVPVATPTKDKEAPPTPPCIKWAQSLLNLLNDSDGVAQFMDYLESEGPHHAAALRFWLACEGVRKQDQQDKAQQYAQAIFSFFVQSPLLPIDEHLRAQISAALNSDEPLDIPVTIFDEAQLQVENEINTTTYPNFLQSEIYLQCLQSVQTTPPVPYEEEAEEPSSECYSVREFQELENLACGVGSLPTLHEDLEFIPKPLMSYSQTPGTNAQSTGCPTPNINQPLKLTKDLLLMSQQHRAAELRPQSEAYASLFLYRNMGAHAAYNSYNPVSRQDSEMQSLSSRSDVRTESDNMSMTDSSVDGRTVSRTVKRKAALEAKRAKESAAVNRETHMHQTIIPRTQRLDARNAEPPKDPQQFASILIKKLETINEKEVEIELERRFRLLENDSVSIQEDKHRIEPQSRALANVLKEKLLLLQPEDDDDQDILDQHVSRVFSDLTPSRSPGVASPRPHSPHRSRYPLPMVRPKRRDKDGYSTFSSDSGNVHDFQEGSEHRLSMVKSKSMPEYGEERFVRSSAGRRSASKKTLTDLTDSGVSVVSDTPPVVPAVVPVIAKDNRVLAWLMEADRSTKSQSGPHSELSSGKHSRHRVKGFVGSRSNSLERGAGAETLGPTQPFIADPNIPLPPLPNTINQLEEARRRLLDDDFRTRSRVRSSTKYYPDVTQSGQSTLRKSTRGVRPAVPGTGAATPDEYTTVVFSYADEQFPYRIKIPGSQVTFRQFKEYLPKKGNYRYFFKTVCEELDNQVIQEELNKDSDILPLCEGKVMALAKPID